MNSIGWSMTTGLFKGFRWLLAWGLCIGTLAGCDDPIPRQATVPPTEVTALPLAPVDVPLLPEFVAGVRSSHQVDIVARVNGFLERIAYAEGSLVNKGDVLFQIDPAPFEAQLAAEKAEFERHRAEHWIAKSDLDRIRPLAEQKAASRSDLENAVGRLRVAEAMLAKAKASVQKAEFELGYTTVTSPIRGVAGEARVREGAFLKAGSPEADLTTVTAMDPIWVAFSVTQSQYLRMRGEVNRGAVTSPDIGAYEIEVVFGEGQAYAPKGRFTFAEPNFNQATGTFQVRVELPNPEGTLVPGMAVRVRVKGAFRPNAIVIPQKAVQQTANGHIVYIVNARNEAEVRPVVMGEWVGQDWIVDQGLQPGDVLIVDGFQRLAPGAPVTINTATPTGQTARPAESR